MTEQQPFCRHWDDPSDCEELCACGHSCSLHEPGVIDGDCSRCRVDGCACEAYADV